MTFNSFHWNSFQFYVLNYIIFTLELKKEGMVFFSFKCFIKMLTNYHLTYLFCISSNYAVKMNKIFSFVFIIHVFSEWHQTKQVEFKSIHFAKLFKL